MTFWQRQDPTKPLFPEVEWSKPERRDQAGRLTILGGSKLGFAAVATAYDDALKIGVGQCRVVLPDALKRSIPTNITDTVFVPTNPSGGMAKDGLPDVKAAANWANVLLMIGDAGRNSETAIIYEEVLRTHTGPIVITRDAVDLLKNSTQHLVMRDKTLLILSFAQLQKLFQAVYYPKILTFSMQLTNLVDALHKFTITYPLTIAVLHSEQLIVAHGGQVTSTPWQYPMAIWRGSVATHAAAYWLWNTSKPLEAVTTSLVKGVG